MDSDTTAKGGTTNDEREAFFLYADEIDKKSKEQEEDFYEVEKIIKMKIQKGKNLFLVKWVGYPSSENTWEPKENLDDGARESHNSQIV